MVKFYRNPAAMNTNHGRKNNEFFDSFANLDSCLWRIRRFLRNSATTSSSSFFSETGTTMGYQNLRFY